MKEEVNYEFWKSWKNKNKQEIRYIKALEKALNWIKRQNFMKDIESIYVKGSFVFRELGKKSDIDVVPIIKNKKVIKVIKNIRDQNKEWLKPVEFLPIWIGELSSNKRLKKPKFGNFQGKPDHFTVLLPYHKIVYGKRLNAINFKVRTDKKIYDDLKQAIQDRFINLYEKGEFGFSQLTKQVSHLFYWEKRLKGKTIPPSWKALKDKGTNNNLLQKTIYLRYRPTKNKQVRKRYIRELKKYLKNK